MISRFDEVITRIRSVKNTVEANIIDIYQAVRRLENEEQILSKDELSKLCSEKRTCIYLLSILNDL